MVPYKLALIVVMVPFMASCGSSSQPQAGSTVVNQPGSNTVTYTLTATNSTTNVILSVSQAAQVSMPETLTALAGGSWLGRADLTIGSTFCAYQSDRQGVYVRQDGSCNTFQPDAPFEIAAGTTLVLEFEGCPPQNTAVEAVVSGTPQ